MLWRTGRMPLLATPSALAGELDEPASGGRQVPVAMHKRDGSRHRWLRLDHYAPECCGELGQRTWE